MWATIPFNDSESGNTWDGNAISIARTIPYKCKDRILDNGKYTSGTGFAKLLAKPADAASVENKIIQIEFGHGKLEGIKTIVAIRNKSEVYHYQSILGGYKVRT